MKGWFTPIAVFYSSDGGEYCVSPAYAGRFRVFGPWTCDSVWSDPDPDKAIAFAEKQAGPGCVGGASDAYRARRRAAAP